MTGDAWSNDQTLFVFQCLVSLDWFWPECFFSHDTLGFDQPKKCGYEDLSQNAIDKLMAILVDLVMIYVFNSML